MQSLKRCSSRRLIRSLHTSSKSNTPWLPKRAELAPGRAPASSPLSQRAPAGADPWSRGDLIQKGLAPRRQAAKGCLMSKSISAPPEDEIAREVVDAAFKVHTRLGPGLLESVYQAVLAHELEQRGLLVRREVPIAVVYDDLHFGRASGRSKQHFDIGFRADLLVNDRVIVELKSVEQIAPVHKKQALTDVKLAKLRLGLLINFGASRIKDGITRLVNGLPE